MSPLFVEALGRWNSAIEPGDATPEQVFMAGALAHRSGAFDLAEACYRNVIETRPDVPEVWRNLAAICFTLDRFRDACIALEHHRELVAYDREAFGWHVYSYVELGRLAEAQALLDDYVRVFPYDPSVVQAQVYLCEHQRRFLAGLMIACRGQKDAFASSVTAEGALVACQQLERFDLFEALLALVYPNRGLDPDPAVLRFLADSYALRDRPDMAEEYYRRYLEVAEPFPVVCLNLSLVLLCQGKYAEAWKYFRSRPEALKRRIVFDVPEWRGEPLAGKALLINSEQGFGDVIQFIRYLPALRATGARVVFQTYPDILQMLRTDPRSAVAGAGAIEEIQGFDYQTQIMDAPSYLDPEGFADTEVEFPYLVASPEKVAAWAERLGGLGGVRIGLVWAGNADHRNDHNRSAALADFASLAALPGVEWISLQKGPASAEISGSLSGLPVLDLAPEIEDFADTAAIIENLDLLVAVDTSVIHLAGAMARPAWLLLPKRGEDWRWRMDAETSRWYPTVRLLRQEAISDWRGFVERTLLGRLAAWLSKSFVDARPWIRGLWQVLASNAVNELDVVCWRNTVAQDEAWDAAFQAALRCPGELRLRLLSDLGQYGPSEIQRRSTLALRCLVESPDGDVSLAEIVACEGRQVAAFVWSETIARLGESESGARKASWVAQGLKEFPGEIVLLKHLARERQQRGDVAGARDVLESILKLTNRDPEVLAWMVDCLDAFSLGRGLDLLQRALLVGSPGQSVWDRVAVLAINHHAPWLAEMILAHGEVESLDNRRLLVAAGAALGRTDVVARLASLLAEVPADWNPRGLGHASEALGLDDEAENLFRKAVELSPHEAAPHLSLAFFHLRRSRFVDGWRHYQLAMNLGPDHFPLDLPRWSGEEFRGRKLLIYQDQGYGDLIQFLPLLKQLPESVEYRLAVWPEALELVTAQLGTDRVLLYDAETLVGLGFDYRVPFMGLVANIAPDLTRPPSELPYLTIPAGSESEFAVRCAADPQLKIGIVWAGNPRHGNDFKRSSQLDDWLPLAGLNAVSLYSLQKDGASNQALCCPQLQLNNVAESCSGLMETARALQRLDLFISVDSGLAHLAACLGKETWLLLPQGIGDFRWGLEGERVGWYPTVRLFRRGAAESWRDVLERVADHLVREKGVHWKA